MAEVAFEPARRLASRIARRQVGSLELLDHYLARLERLNPAINAIVVTDVERARADARAADEAVARGDALGPLHGVPMTVKESFDVQGLPTTWGDPAFAGHRAERDALAVARFRAAGAVVFGKSNVPLMLADWQSYNAVYGTTGNPWDTTRSPGGSSGGAAAALAAGLTGLEAGSDIGASIRNPAHYCGVWGHKPTWGICPMLGHALAGRVTPTDISVIGPLARSAADLEVALGVMAGPDPIEAAGWRLALAPPRGRRLADFRVAVMLEDPCSAVDGEVKDAIARLADFLARQGATVDDRARPAIDTAEAQRVYVHLLRAATSGRMSDAAVAANEAALARLAPDDESYFARTTRANLTAHRAWLASNEARHRMRWRWHEFFRDWDVLLCPAAASAAFPHDQAGERWERTIEVDGRPVPTTDQLFWAGFPGVALLPATVAPIGRTRTGLPVGVQIVAAQYHDRTAIALARLLERSYYGFAVPPGFA